ncbi:MAG: hypothetical protein E6L00_04295, partial [Thaumarchaeota archaeon]
MIYIIYIMQVIQHGGVKTFLDSMYSISHSQSTLLNCKVHLRKMQKFLRESYNCNEEEIFSLINEGKVDVYKLLNQFVIFLDKDNRRPSTIRVCVSVAKNYLKFHGVKIYTEDMKGVVRLPKKRRTKETPLTKEMIVSLLRVLPMKLQTTVLVLCASGMRIGELVHLTIDDIDFQSNPTHIA